MKSTLSLALSSLIALALALALVLAAAGTPALAAEAAPGAETAIRTVDMPGEITTISEAAGVEASLFHVRGLGYLNVDFSAVELDRTSVGSITLRLQAPEGFAPASGLAAEFAALSAYATGGRALHAVSIVANRSPEAMVNQGPATQAVHKVFAVVVTPANVAGSSATLSQSPANIEADVAQADQYWRSQSENKVGFQLAGVSSWYHSSFDCDDGTALGFSNLIAEANSVAGAELGYRDVFNNHLVVVFPSGSACGSLTGQATIGAAANAGGALWVVGTESPSEQHALSRALGHNLSLGSSTWLDCGTATLNSNVYTWHNPCTGYEGGAVADVMATGLPTSTGGSLSSAHAIRAGLWSSAAYALAPQGTTTYVLNALSTNSGRRAIVLEDQIGTNFFVEFRDTTGIDAPFASAGCPEPSEGVGYCAAPVASVQIQRLELQEPMYWPPIKGQAGDESQLVGKTVLGERVVGYTAGQSFTAVGIVVTVVSISGTQATVTVTRPTVSAQQGQLFMGGILSSPGGDFYVGDTLTASLDYAWIADYYKFQWYRNGYAIPGATHQNYVMTAADIGSLLKARVTSVTAGSPNITVEDPSIYTGWLGYGPIRPGVLTGAVLVKAATLPLAAGLVSWSASGVTFSYQWKRNGANIAGATASTYRPVAADDGKQLSVAVTGKKSGYTSVTVVSAAKNYTLVSTGTLAISGMAQVGQELGVNPLDYSTVDGPATVARAYQWYRSGIAIAGATGDDYTLVAADLGKLITAKVTATSAGYASNTSTTAATTAVVRGDIAGSYEAPLVTQAPGTLQLSVALPLGSITESGTASAYQWYRDDVVIPGAIAATYTLTAADYGKAVKARIVVTKLNYNSVALSSAATAYSVLSSGSAAITGTVRVGEVLTAPELAYSTWEGFVGTTRTFQWYRNGIAIVGATSNPYTLVVADYNTKLTVRVTASLSEFLPSIVTSPPTVVVAKGVLAGTQAAPSVDKNGTLLLTASPTAGSFTDSGVAYAYQWFRNGVAIVGATLPTFQLTAADYNKTTSVRQTASKLNYTSVVGTSAPVNYSLVSSPVVPSFHGDVAQGLELSLDEATFTAGGDPVVPSIGMQWVRDGIAIPLATSMNYTLQAADVGKTISVRVTATYAGYLSSVSTSAGTQKVGADLLGGASTPVTVSKTGNVLTAVPGVTEAGTTFARQWYRDGVAIYLATGTTYTLTAADYNKLISVRVTSSKPGYTTVVAFSQGLNYSIIAGGAVAITGTAQVGATLTSVPPSYTDLDGAVVPTFTRQWLRNGVAIPGATAATYTLVAADLGTKTSVRVVAAASGFLSSTLTSPMTVAVVKGVIAGSREVPTMSQDVNTMVLTGALPAGSITEPGVSLSYQWLRDQVPIVGATMPSYHLTSAADYGKALQVRVTVAKLNYTSVSLTSDPIVRTVYSTSFRPVIVGAVAQGQVLAVAPEGYVAGLEAATPAYQWLRDGVAITLNGTGSTYTPVAADLGHVISVRVTATHVGFLPSIATSVPTQKVGATFFSDWDAPATVEKSGLLLTAVPGTISAAPTYAYQWYRNSVAIPLATAATFQVTAADYGKSISVRVTATKATYTPVVATSVGVDYSVTPLAALAAPTGIARVGMTLTASTPSYFIMNEGVVSPTLTYQWLRNGVPIGGATGSTYTAVAADYNTKLSVRVTAAQAGFLSNTTTSAATAVVAKGVFTGTMAAPTVTSNPVTFKLSVALTPGSIDQSAPVLSYQWYRNGVAIYLATGSSYQLTGADVGKDIKVRVTVAKTNYISVVQYSAVVVP